MCPSYPPPTHLETKPKHGERLVYMSRYSLDMNGCVRVGWLLRGCELSFVGPFWGWVGPLASGIRVAFVRNMFTRGRLYVHYKYIYNNCKVFFYDDFVILIKTWRRQTRDANSNAVTDRALVCSIVVQFWWLVGCYTIVPSTDIPHPPHTLIPYINKQQTSSDRLTFTRQDQLIRYQPNTQHQPRTNECKTANLQTHPQPNPPTHLKDQQPPIRQNTKPHYPNLCQQQSKPHPTPQTG